MRLVIIVGVVVGALGLSFQQAGASQTPSLGARVDATASQPYWQNANKDAVDEGHLGLNDRTKDVQVIMQTMYSSDAHFHSFAGLFVDTSPGDHPGSIRIAIQQPQGVRTAVYTSLDGTGQPVEVTATNAIGNEFYAPGANLSAQEHNRVPVGHLSLPPLASVPLGVVAGQGSATTVEALSDGGGAGLANMYLHPSTLITCPFFTNKSVAVDGSSTYEGRPVWVLVGTQVPTAPVLGNLGDSWRMLVDQGTGIILEVQYLSSGTTEGVAKFVNVTIDGSGTGTSAATTAIPSIPGDAAHVDGPTLEKAVGDKFH